MISMIVCLSENNVIGNNNTMPWNLPEDLRYFKNTTLGHKIVMGRNTFDSLGSALPGRENIILSSSIVESNSFKVYRNVESILNLCNSLKDEEIFIIGGSQIYKSFLPYSDKLYVTKYHRIIEGDCTFPIIDSSWKCISNSPSKYSPADLSFLIYERAEE